MLPFKKKLLLVLLGFGCSLIAAAALNLLLAWLPENLNLNRPLDLFFYRLFFTPARNIHPDLRLIGLDEKPDSLRTRLEFAQMIRRLHEAGARCIALDVVFAQEKDPAGDQALVEAVKAAGHTVLAMDFRSEQRLADATRAELKRLALTEEQCNKFAPLNEVSEGLNLPFRGLLLAAHRLGHINTVSDQNHHFPPVLRYLHDGNCYPVLPVAIAECYFSSFTDTSARHGAGHASGQRPPANFALDLPLIPVDNEGHMLINFVAEEDFWKHTYSWNSVSGLADTTFKDKVVLIISRSTEEEKIETPLELYPRWAVLASLTNQLLLDEHIKTSVVAYHFLLNTIIVTLALLLFFFVAPRWGKAWRRTRHLFAGGSVVILAFIFLYFHFTRAWIGVTVPLLVYIASMAAVRRQYYRYINPPRYLNFELAILERRGDQYPIKADSPAGAEEGDLFLAASALEDEKFVQAMARLKAYQTGEGSVAEADLKKIGSTLFQGIFHDDSLELLNRSLEEAKKQDRSLRLVMQIDAAELACLPWELMHNPKPPRLDLVLNEEISLIRFTPLKRSPPKLTYKTPLTILVAIANPVDAQLRPLDVEAEKNKIAEQLRPLTLEVKSRWLPAALSRYLRLFGDVRLRFCENATLDKLRTELEEGEDIDVLHFIGHSRIDPETKSSFLELETESGSRDSVSAEALGDILNNSQVKLVLLNSCQGAAASSYDAFSGLAQTLVSIGVPGVVAMQFPIRDDTAVLFSETFYSTLITNFSVETAIARVRRRVFTVKREDKLGWATPVVFLRSKEGIIFMPE